LSFGRGDPAFISEIALTTLATVGSDSGFEQADGSSDCINQVVARAPLVWTFGPLRPYLGTLVDGGPQGGAGGEVVIDATGRPVAYTVALNDLPRTLSHSRESNSPRLACGNPRRPPAR
jgi:hypothetical protein